MNGYKVRQVKQNLFFASTGFSLAAFSEFRKAANNVDIIHYHFPNPFADILHLVCAPTKPCVLTYHSDVVKQKYLRHIYKPLQNFFLNSVNSIVATSPNYASSSAVLQRYSEEKLSVIPIGIDQSRYEVADPERLSYWRNRLPERFFLFVGALRYYKGLHVALESIAGTQIKVVIAGANGVEKDLRAQAASLRLDNVDFLGLVSEADKIALLQLCYGFIFPSYLRSEAFGISLLEAAAAGKPMISCEIGTGTSYINLDKETGLVVEPNSPNALRNGMQYLLDHPKTASQMGRNAKKRIYQMFTADQQARAYYTIYQRLLGSNS